MVIFYVSNKYVFNIINSFLQLKCPINININQSKIKSSYIRITIILICGSSFISLPVNSSVYAVTEDEESQRKTIELIPTIRNLLNQTTLNITNKTT